MPDVLAIAPNDNDELASDTRISISTRIIWPVAVAAHSMNTTMFGVKLKAIKKAHLADAAQAYKDHALVMPSRTNAIESYGSSLNKRIATGQFAPAPGA